MGEEDSDEGEDSDEDENSDDEEAPKLLGNCMAQYIQNHLQAKAMYYTSSLGDGLQVGGLPLSYIHIYIPVVTRGTGKRRRVLEWMVDNRVMIGNVIRICKH